MFIVHNFLNAFFREWKSAATPFLVVHNKTSLIHLGSGPARDRRGQNERIPPGCLTEFEPGGRWFQRIAEQRSFSIESDPKRPQRYESQKN